MHQLRRPVSGAHLTASGPQELRRKLLSGLLRPRMDLGKVVCPLSAADYRRNRRRSPGGTER